MTDRAALLASTSLTAVCDPARTLICDTECYPNFWSIGFKRISDNKVRVFEHSVRKPLTDHERETIRAIMAQNTIITYNGNGYDALMITLMLGGANNAKLKKANDQIIVAGIKRWDFEDLHEIRIPKWDHIDLMEPQPNARASLKQLNGRLHGRRMQDLPYSADTELTYEQMDHVLSYMGNDLEATHLTFDNLLDALAMRVAIGKEYGLDFRSKSDAQMGEGMIKKRVEEKLGQRVNKVETPAGTTFPYKIPSWLKVEHPELRKIVKRLEASEFMILPNGKVDSPDWLKECPITIGDTTYMMGIGGLHSTEANRAVHSDEDNVLIDFDVASYYPAIILNSGLYPRSLGRSFIDVYRQIRDERVVAKRAGDKTRDKGLKIALNGSFGKLGSPYSVLYAPHLMIAITLGGQLALLMLIDRAERAGIPVVSGNTDGVVFRAPRADVGPIEKSRVLSGPLADLIDEWERDTDFELEATEYLSLYNSSVNSYFAFKPDGGVKVKGPGWSGRAEGDIRTQMMKNPSAEVVSHAVIAAIRDGVPVEETIRANRDIRDFVRVVQVNGGALWKGEYLGKVVRYIWATGDTDRIIRKVGHWKTGTQGQVPKSDGCRPLMDLPDEFPDDIDYDRYIAEAHEVMMDIGATYRPPVIKPLRVFKYNAVLHWALAA